MGQVGWDTMDQVTILIIVQRRKSHRHHTEAIYRAIIDQVAVLHTHQVVQPREEIQNTLFQVLMIEESLLSEWEQ